MSRTLERLVPDPTSPEPAAGTSTARAAAPAPPPRRRRPWDRPSPADVGREVGSAEDVDVARHPVAAVVLGLALLGLFLLAAAAWGSAVGGGERRAEVGRVVLPRLTGQTVTDAQRQLEDQDLLVALDYRPNEAVPQGVVFDQTPIAGAKVEVGTEVTLVVSDGPTGVPVPDLRGFQGAEAAALLQALGVPAQVESVPDETVRPGEVVGTVPAAGVATRSGTPVVIQVSTGPAPRMVPAVVDQPLASAMVAIGRAGLGIGTVTRRYVEGREPGLVIAADPAPGSAVARDFPVDVEVTGPLVPMRVPSVVGLTKDNAVEVARRLTGVEVRVRSVVLPVGDTRSGRVVRQSLPADTAVTAGMVLELVVGNSPPPPTTTVPVTPTTVPGG